MRINKLFFQLLIVLLYIPAYVFAAWTTSNLGSNAPTGAAKNIDVDSNFHLLFGGSGYSAYGDFAATGESIMYQTNATTDNYTGALYNSTPDYMSVDTAFNTNTYTGGDARKANSSSAKLNLPSYVTGTHIVWAGLFWQGQLHKKLVNSGLTTTQVDNDIDGWNKVTLKTPDGVMHQLTAPIGTKNSSSKTYQYTYKDNTTYRHFYSAYTDVTALVKNTYSSTNNTFTVGNIKVTSGTDTASNMYFSHAGSGEWWSGVYMGHFGGWSLVVVYALDATTAIAHPSEKLKNVSIYDGFDQFLTWGTDGTTFETNINLTGFWTPKSGTVNSKLFFFGGGADQGIQYEKLQIQQKKTAAFTNLTNSLNPVNNQFNSTFSYLGTQMVSGKPYHHGMDMDTYDVSAMMDNTQSSTNVKFGVTKNNNQCDQVFPQILGFSTQLYEPQLCYDYSYKQNNQYLKADNNGSSGIVPVLKGTITYDPLEVAVYIRNKESDISVKGVSFYTDLNTSLFNYNLGTTGTTNVNGTAYNMKTDSSGGCDYTSTSTSSVACNDGHNVRIGLGNGATGYGKTTAGYLDGQEFTYAKFELLPVISGFKDVNESLGLQLNYYIQPDINAAPVVYNYKLGTDISLCPPSTGYQPTWGTFNVVDHYTSSVGGLPANNLRTQVSRKPFEVDVAAYEKNTDGKYTKKPTIDMTTTVLVEVIDNDAFHDVNASCANPGSVITSPIYVGIANTSKDMTIDIPKQDIVYHNFAVKNAAYRLWYFTNQDQSLINWTADTTDNGKTLKPNGLSGLYQAGYHTVCSSACASPTSATCFNCIKINYAKPLCSRDNFAVRPESYDLRIYDINQSLSQASALKDSTKIDLSNQYHYAPEYTSATGRINVAAGYNYRYDINATGNDTNLAKVPGYTRYFNGASNEYNATMIWEPEGGHVTSGCNDLSGKNLSFYVANGQMLNTEQNQTQVGEYRLNIIDPAWTAVDWDSSLLTHHTTTNGFEFIKNDCIEGSDSTSTDEDGKIGCTTTSAHSGGGYTYKDHLLRLKPAKFDLNGIAYGLGKIPLAITTGGVGFVYDSDLNVTNDKVMAVHSYGPLKAVGYGGETLSNFVTQCYATDLDVSISHNADTSLGFSGRMTVAETGGAQIFDSLKFKVTDSPTSPRIDESYFHKVDNGQTVPTIRLNFDRNSTTPKEAQAVHYGDLNVSCTTKSDCAISAMSNTYPNVVKGDKAMDFTVTHVYGRIAANNVRIELNKDFNTTASYEVYKTPTLLGTDLSPDQFDKNWYVNVLHTDANYGDSAVTVVDPSNGSSLPIMSDSTNGREIYQFPDFTVKQGYKAHIDTEGWLWYGGLNALTYADPNGPAQAGTDNLNCLTHPCFNISIMRIVGNTGSAKSESETNKANKKTTSTGWSTTSEYAPAVR